MLKIKILRNFSMDLIFSSCSYFTSVEPKIYMCIWQTAFLNLVHGHIYIWRSWPTAPCILYWDSLLTYIHALFYFILNWWWLIGFIAIRSTKENYRQYLTSVGGGLVLKQVISHNKSCSCLKEHKIIQSNTLTRVVLIYFIKLMWELRS